MKKPKIIYTQIVDEVANIPWDKMPECLVCGGKLLVCSCPFDSKMTSFMQMNTSKEDEPMETYKFHVNTMGFDANVTAKGWREAMITFILENIVIRDAAGKKVFPSEKN